MARTPGTGTIISIIAVAMGLMAFGHGAAQAQAQAQSTVKVVYDCGEGTQLNATFDNAAGNVTLEIGTTFTLVLQSAVSGSGMRFEGGGYAAYGKSGWLNVVIPGQPELKCKETGQVPQPGPVQSQPQLPAPHQPAPQAASPSFNCAGRLNATERRICANPSLAGLDRQMATSYFQVRARLRGNARARLTNDQKNWLARRNRCGANDGCLQGVYRDRIGQLSRY